MQALVQAATPAADDGFGRERSFDSTYSDDARNSDGSSRKGQQRSPVICGRAFDDSNWSCGTGGRSHAVTAPSIWVEDLLNVCIDLLPNWVEDLSHEVKLCKALLKSLLSSGTARAEFLGHSDASDVNRVVSESISSMPKETTESERVILLEVQKRLQISADSHDDSFGFLSLRGAANGGPIPQNEDGDAGRNGQDEGGRHHRHPRSSKVPRDDGPSLNGRGHTDPKSSKDIPPLPWLPPPSSGNLRRRLFIILEDARACVVGKICAWFMIIVIAVCTLSFILASLPQFKYTPEECLQRKAAGLPLTIKACEPKSDDIFFFIDAVCIIIFTIDYALRAITVHADCDAAASGLLRTLRYLREPMNLIDLIAIVPFYFDAFFPDAPLGFVKVLRLARILRPFKMAKHHKGVKMFAEVMKMSGQPLMVLLFFNMMMIVFFASLIYYAERGSFTVSPQFIQRSPAGLYSRMDKQAEGEEVSPFRSIPYSFWFVCVTMTTVGYGDITPTTPVGKAIGICVFYVGILFIAFPLGVLSSNFHIVYAKYHKSKFVHTGGKLAGSKKMFGSFGKFKIAKSSKGDNYSLPWFPSSVEDSVCMIRRRFFLMLHEPSTCKMGKFLQISMVVTIFISVAIFMMETMPEYSNTPDACVLDRLTVDSCKPEAVQAMQDIETACVILFTADYVLRVSLAHACFPEDFNLSYMPGHEPSGLALTMKYIVQPLNIIDFLAVAPFYIELAAGSEDLEVVRIVRLARLLRLLKTPKMQQCADMFKNVIVDAAPALVTLLFTTALMCILFASFMVFAETSSFSVDDTPFVDEYPYGVYIRPTTDGYGKEVSPYTSIPYACWWFFVTSTTVGYGDDVPTTTMGRCIALCTFYLGIVLLALPLTIVGQSFQKFYPQWVKEFHSQEPHEPEKLAKIKTDLNNSNELTTKSARFVAWQ